MSADGENVLFLDGFEYLLISHGVNGLLIGHTREIGDEFRWRNLIVSGHMTLYADQAIKFLTD